MQISEPAKAVNQGLALFALAFRPFFLVAGLSAVALLVIWLYSYTQGLNLTPAMPGLNWHSHEMIFGYSSAVIAGFLLTAVRNWTGVQTLRGGLLAALAMIWLAARVLAFTPVELFWLAMIDLAFLPLVAVAVACPIVRVRQWKNLFFVPLILLFSVSNGLFYAEFLWGLQHGEEWGIHSGLGVIIVIITIMAGRVVGFFIERGINQQVRHYRWANLLALWGSVLFMAGQFILPASVLSVLALLAAAGHAGRVYGWHNAALWKNPLLWVLYLGYGWMVVGFILLALAQYQQVLESLAVHAFTVGVIGVMTLGMMARVALGHTGRPMQSHQLMNIAFVLINLAPFIRVFMPVLLPELSMSWVQLAGIFWIMAFMVFSWIYWPVLLKPRVDGAPG